MTSTSPSIRIGTYNACSTRGESLELLLKAIRPMALDICLLTETRLQGFHTLFAQNFEVFATRCSTSTTGGVTLLHRVSKNPSWHLESQRTHGENVVSALLIAGPKQWMLIGAYLSPSVDPANTLSHVYDAAARSTAPVIFLGDFNCRMEGDRDRDISVATCAAAIGAPIDLCLPTLSPSPYLAETRQIDLRQV